MAYQSDRAELPGCDRGPRVVRFRCERSARGGPEVGYRGGGYGLLAPEIAAGIAKVPGARPEGARAGNWLTREQAARLLSLPDPETRKGKRDRAILGLLYRV
jgi:hypothetical protein